MEVKHNSQGEYWVAPSYPNEFPHWEGGYTVEFYKLLLIAILLNFFISAAVWLPMLLVIIIAKIIAKNLYKH